MSALRKSSPSELANIFNPPNATANQLKVILRAICYVCYNYENKRKFGKAGGCRGLASLFKSTLSSGLVELLCLAVVTTCQECSFNKTELGEAGGCEGLLSIVKQSYYYNINALEKACKAIVCISSGNASNIDHFKRLKTGSGGFIFLNYIYIYIFTFFSLTGSSLL